MSSSTLEKGLTVLEAVEKSAHPVTIQELAAATGIQRLAVYRLLTTLEQRGYVQRDAQKRYSSTTRRRRVLAGYLAPLSGTPFRLDVTASVREAAARAGFDMLVLGNGEDDAEAALRNAETLIEARADVAMFFQPVESLGHMIADRFFHAKIPFITIERPIQGGTYFGANNYQAGRLAGQELGRFAARHWRGRFDRVVLVEAAHTGTNVQARLAGVLVGLREVLGAIEDSHVVHVDGHAHLESSREAVAAFLRRIPKGARLLISGFNDPSSVGALEAVRAAGRERDTAIVGQNATREGRAEICRKNSCFIASVAYFPERYGAKLLNLASAIVHGDVVPPAVYTEHLVLNHDNVDRYYPE